MTDTPTTTQLPARARVWRVLAAVGLVLALLGGGLAWLLTTPSGLQWAWRGVMALSAGQLSVQQPSGSLIGPMKLGQLQWRTPEQRVLVTELELDWAPGALWHGQLQVLSARARRVDLSFKSSPGDSPMPTQLQLPMPLKLAQLEVAESRWLPWTADASVAALPALVLRDLRAALDSHAAAHALRVESVQTPWGRMQGDLQLATASPYALNLRAQLAALDPRQPYEVRLQGKGDLQSLNLDLQASGGPLQGRATSHWRPLAAMPLTKLELQVSGIDPAAFVAGAPSAGLSVQAQLKPRQTSGVTAWADLVLAGSASLSNDRPGPLDLGRWPVHHASAQLAWSQASATLSELKLALGRRGDALVTGQLQWKDSTLSGLVQTAGLDPAELHSAARPTRLSANLNLQLDAAQQSLRGTLAEVSARWGPVPWQGRFASVRRGSQIEVSEAHISDGRSVLDATGRFSMDSSRAFDAKGHLQGFEPARFAKVPAALLSGDVQLHGAFQPALQLDLAFQLQNSQLKTPEGWRALAGQGVLQLADGRVLKSDVTLDLVGNKLLAQGSWGRVGDSLRLDLDAPALGALGAGWQGRLKASARLGGTPQAPSGEIQAEGDGIGLAQGWQLGKLSLQAQLRDGLDGVLQGQMQASDLRATSQAAPLLQQLRLELSGSRASNRSHAELRLDAQNQVELDAAGALLDGPAWRGMLQRLVWRNPTAQVDLAAPATLALSPQSLQLGAAELRARQTRLLLHDTLWSAQGWRSRAEFSQLQFHLVRPESGGPALPAQSLSLGGQWDLRSDEHLNGRLQVRRDSGDLWLPTEPAQALGLKELQLDVQVQQGLVQAQAQVQGEQLGRASASARLMLQRWGELWRPARQQPLAVQAHVDMPSLAWLGPLMDPNVQLQGRALGDLDVTGTLEQPLAKGQLQISNLAVALVAQGLRLGDGQMKIEFNDSEARLTEFSLRSELRTRPKDARLGDAVIGREPGRLSASGALRLSDGRGQIAFKASRLAALQSADRWLLLSGDVNLVTAWDALAATGHLRADAGYFELSASTPPSLSDDVLVLGRQGGPSRNLRLSADMTADLGDHTYLRGRGFDTRLTGDLRLRMESRGPLRLTGSIAARDGTFDAYGQSLSIERGIVNFQGSPDAAGLNVRALRKGLAVEAGVDISGTVSRPQVRLVSEPNVPDVEKLSWIVAGRGMDGTSSADSALLVAAAGAILGGSSGGITQQLAQGLGLDQFSLGNGGSGSGSLLPSTTLGGSTQGSRDTALASQIVTLGKRLSADAYLSYEQSLSGASNVVKLTYQLSRRLSVTGRAGTDNAIDLNYTFSFN